MSKQNTARKIRPVEGREDKQNTYKEQMTRYKKAMNNDFCLEAIVIDYACMEDRLRFMLYYLGVLHDEQDYKVSGNSSRVKEFRNMLHEYEGEKANLAITSITGKRKIINSVFRMVSEPNKPNEAGSIRQTLWTALHDENHDEEILTILKEIEEWCGYRNEVIHSLLNKNTESLYEQIKAKAEEGYQLFRRLDNQVQWIKRKKIREKLGLKN